jgi:hypothetical protein
MQLPAKLTNAVRGFPDGRWAGDGCPGQALSPALSWCCGASRSLASLGLKATLKKLVPHTCGNGGRATGAFRLQQARSCLRDSRL